MVRGVCERLQQVGAVPELVLDGVLQLVVAVQVELEGGARGGDTRARRRRSSKTYSSLCSFRTLCSMNMSALIWSSGVVDWSCFHLV